MPDWVLRWVPADWETGAQPLPGIGEGDGELALYRRLCSHRRWSDAGRAWRAEHRHLT